MVKYFSFASSNRKNYKHICIPKNQLEKDHNRTSVVDAHKFIRSALRVKRGVKEYYREFNVRHFITVNEWKIVRKFEGVLRETSRVTTIYQHEEKLNSAHGPAMRKELHDSLSRDTIALIDVEEWSK